MKRKMKLQGINFPISQAAKRPLLFSGIAASLIYIGTDALAASLYKDYSYADQAISELSAIGAPTAWLWQIMSFIFNPLIIAFGLGVWLSGDHKPSMRITGILLTIWGILGFVWLLFPMNMRGAIGSASDTGHLVLSGITVLLITFFISFGSGASGRRFRIYSVLTIIVMLSFGAMTGMQASKVAAQLPTPWMGITERVSVFSAMIWMLFLALTLLKSKNKGHADISGIPA